MSIIQKSLAPFTLKGFYLLTWGTALGTNVWNTLSSYCAYRCLNRQTFGYLQTRIFPFYLSTSALLQASLFLTHLYFHPSLIPKPQFKLPLWHRSEEGIQGLLILGALVPTLVNCFSVGPAASKVLIERHRLEKIEGTEYDAPGPSDAMSKINSRFSTLHGISSTLNLVTALSLAALGLAVSM